MQITAGVIGIGTSPLMLMRAIRLAEAGKKVTLLDRAKSPGGAWSTETVFGYSSVEPGVHLFENRGDFYTTLKDGLGIEMETDDCVSVLFGQKLSMHWTRAAFHFVVGLRGLSQGRVDKWRRTWRTALRSAAAGSDPFLYPRMGAAGFIQELCQRLGSVGGCIQFGVEVASIEIGASAVSITTDFGRLNAERAIISSRAFAPITIGGSPQGLDLERARCRNIVARIEHGGETTFSYAEILGHARLKRVRDLSALVNPKPKPPERILCLQHRSGMSGEPFVDAVTLTNDLVRMGLLSATAKVLDAVRRDMVFSTLASATMARLEGRCFGRLEALATTDLADSFVDQSARLAF